MTQCPLCGYEFDETALSCHSSCAFNESCGIICCPNCGYQVADERKSRLATTLRRMLTRQPQPTADTPSVRPLSALYPGQSGKVVSIDSTNHGRVERLHVLGLVEDARVILQQRRPTMVLRVGFTELSIEREIADEILVEVDPLVQVIG